MLTLIIAMIVTYLVYRMKRFSSNGWMWAAAAGLVTLVFFPVVVAPVIDLLPDAVNTPANSSPSVGVNQAGVTTIQPVI